ncbi:MAG: hypothetical protein V7634_4109 [Bradyrhizobium sp.]|jgi:hypothetical protein
MSTGIIGIGGQTSGTLRRAVLRNRETTPALRAFLSTLSSLRSDCPSNTCTALSGRTKLLAD